MPSRDIQLVCFDLGGVLLRCVDGWAHACELAGEPMYPSLAECAHRDQIVRASHQMEVGTITPRQFAEQVAACSEYNVDQVSRVLDAWLIELYPGAAELIGRVLESNVQVALLSNTNPAHWRIVEQSDRFAPVLRIPHRFVSHAIGARKPEAAAYQHVEHTLRLAPESILFFDDLEENLAGAVWQHWQTEHIDPRNNPVAQLEKYLTRRRIL